MSPRVVTLTLLVISALVGGTATAHAAPITGTVNLSGTLGISALTVDFFGNPASGCTTPGVGTLGCFLANVPLTGDFATLTPGTLAGTIKDLQGPPISGNISLVSFMSFINGVVFDLTRVVPGSAPDCATVNQNAANVTCTPIIGGMVSPFVLTNNATGTNASIFFSVEVSGYLGTLASGFTPYLGTFNTPAAGQNIAGILTTLANGQTVSTGYSSTFAPRAPSTVPEPEAYVLLAAGLLAFFINSRRV